MDRIATVTIIRGNGACEAYMNGVVREEILKMNERHNMEMQTANAKLQATTNHRNKLLADKVNNMNNYNAKPSFFARIRESITTSWAVVWGLGEALGFWEYIGEDD